MKNGSVIGRVKELRKAVLPDMIESTLDEQEMDRRWRQLQDMEFAQQLSLYPPKYVASTQWTESWKRWNTSRTSLRR